MSSDNSDILSARAYIESLDLGELEPEVGHEATIASASAPAEVLSESEQLITVGGTIAQISPGVAPGLRTVISNSLLLAHLNAKNKLSLQTTPQQWLTHYTDVLSNIGWLPTSAITVEQTFSGTNLELKENIIGIVSAILGNAAPLTAATVIYELLQGLESEDRNKPWITLFDRETRSAQTQLFQLGHAYLNKMGDPEIALIAMELDANRDFIQILVFKYQGVTASIKQVSNTVRTNTDTIMSLANQLDKKLSAHASQFIADMPILDS